MTDYLREQIETKLEPPPPRHHHDTNWNEALDMCLDLLDTVRCDRCVHWQNTGGGTWGVCKSQEMRCTDGSVTNLMPAPDFYCAAFNPKGDE